MNNLQVKKSILTLVLVLAIVIGGVSTYFVLESSLFQDGSGQTEITEQGMTEADYQKMIDNLTESIALPKVSQAYSLIQSEYIDTVSEEELVEGAVRGMLATLNDPYSEYLDVDAMEQFNEAVESSFEGIGAEVSMIDDRVTIVSPITDSPAEKAGLRPNDRILAVDGESVAGLDLHEAVAEIRGEKGSEVTIEIERPGVPDPLNFTLIRDTIPLETIYADVVEHGDQTAGVIQITSFAEQTANRFEEELIELENQGIDGLVIDVRGNPGGLLDVTEDILSLFVTSDQPYMQVADNNDNRQRYYSSLEEAKEYPISVLIDEGSASASEILAISLNETIGAEIVGKNSFGKGTVQSMVSMGDGSNLKITILKWLSPEGHSIHEVGVEPTVEVDQPEYYYTPAVQIEETLRYDDNNLNISFSQILLDALGYQVDRKDGYFSEQTVDAVSDYQADQGLEVTGELNRETSAMMVTDIIDRVRSDQDDLQKDAAIQILFE